MVIASALTKMLIAGLAVLLCLPAVAQKRPRGIPDVLRLAKGIKVKTMDEWEGIRRPEILELFRKNMYGYSPESPGSISFRVLSSEEGALGGTATRRQVRVYFDSDTTVSMDILMYLPVNRPQPVPVFVGLNFYGNQTISEDPAIIITDQWVPENDDFGVVDNRATEASRGVRVSRWPVERILARGYGVATAYCGDIDPDFDDGFRNGVHGLFDNRARNESSWGTIAAWAWGLQRVMDYLETDDDVDRSKVAVLGHSRLGKAALWAGAQDPRFAMVISNDSGEGGAALSRNEKGESIADITTTFPHWFCAKYSEYAGKVQSLPIDQHMLLSLVAPRLLYVASASEDAWADPEGEFLSARLAGPVYKLYDRKGLGKRKMPQPDSPVQEGNIAYHLRTGKHDITPYDWDRFMDFADKKWRDRKEK